MKLGPLWIHRLEQWDLECWPLVCVHWRRPNSTTRIFCLWTGGVQIGRHWYCTWPEPFHG